MGTMNFITVVIDIMSRPRVGWTHVRSVSPRLVRLGMSEKPVSGVPLQVIAALNSDKDSLETALYELQQTAAKLENRKEQLEAEVQELQLAKEAVAGTDAEPRPDIQSPARNFGTLSAGFFAILLYRVATNHKYDDLSNFDP